MPDLQYDGLRDYAAHADLVIVQDYCDVAVSGRREGRPKLNALMSAARNREIDCVLVWKFDRFARSRLRRRSGVERAVGSWERSPSVLAPSNRRPCDHFLHVPRT